MEMITIRTFQDYFTANIILAKLQQEGIPCFLRDEYTATIDPLLTNAIGGIKLVINKKDMNAALSALEEFDKEYREAVICPACGSDKVTLEPRKAPGNILTTILTWLFSGVPISVENVYRCQRCNFESETMPENSTLYN